ncbi:MAG: SurA N-terminal domain-containing protein [Deltaproteobacteria bacterium]|nr:SurA N-terminal domain-containing protein [Deltaproteobacteria bacterium]
MRRFVKDMQGRRRPGSAISGCIAALLVPGLVIAAPADEKPAVPRLIQRQAKPFVAPVESPRAALKSPPPTSLQAPSASKGAVTSPVTATPVTRGELMDEVVASIDGDPVTVSDVTRYTRSLGDEKKIAALTAGKESFEQLTREYIGRELLEREAKAGGFSVDEQEIQKYIAEIKRQNNVDDAQFAELLTSRGLSMEDYRKQIVTDVLRTRVIGSRVRSKINVSDADVTRYLEQHPETNVAPTSGTRFEQIFVPADVGRDRAEEIHQAVADGQDFAATGGSFYSDLGFLAPTDMKTELASVASGLDRHQVSTIIETESGYYILRLAEKNEEGVAVSEEVKEEVKQRLFQERFREEISGYLVEELPKKYNVELH